MLYWLLGQRDCPLEQRGHAGTQCLRQLAGRFFGLPMSGSQERMTYMRFQDNDFLLFTGDSVTDAGRGRPVGEGLGEGVGTGYVRAVDTLMNAFFPDLRLRISNTGTSGNTVRDLAERWQSDVLDLKPDWLSVCIGINDVWRQYDMPNVTHRHVYPEEYRQTLEDLVCRTRQKVKGIVLMTPYYMEPCKEDWMRARMDEYGAIVRPDC